MAVADRDGNHVVDSAEVALWTRIDAELDEAARTRREEMRTRALEDAFMTMDRNHDGRLSYVCAREPQRQQRYPSQWWYTCADT